MGAPHGVDLRWRAVYAVWWDGLDFVEVAKKLSSGPMTVSAKWVSTVWSVFADTGSVGASGAVPAVRC